MTRSIRTGGRESGDEPPPDDLIAPTTATVVAAASGGDKDAALRRRGQGNEAPGFERETAELTGVVISTHGEGDRARARRGRDGQRVATRAQRAPADLAAEGEGARAVC